MSVIDEVKQRADIVEIAGQYTVLTKAGRNFKGICPFHSEKHASFFIYPEQQSWHCFGACGTGGDVFSLIMKKEGLDFGEALRLTAERVGVVIPQSGWQVADKEKHNRLYQANVAAADYFHRLLLDSKEGEKARNYIAKRGISEESINAFNLGFCLNSWDALKQHLLERGYSQEELISAGLVIEAEAGGSHDRFLNKLMFPIQDTKKRTIGFGSRVLDDSQPKYINSPETPLFNKSSCLYAIDLAREAIREQDTAVIVEGYMDVIAAHDNGFKNVIASMGTSITDKHIAILKKLTHNVILALDADTAGGEAALRGIAYENSLGAEVRVAVLPEGKDPDDVIRQSKEQWQQIIGQAVPIMDYAFDRLTSGLDLTSARDKSLAVDKLLPLITAVNDLVRQGHYIQKLARLADISVNKLEMIIENNRVKRRQPVTRPGAETTGAADTQKALISNPREEYCLSLLLQHPELKHLAEGLPPDYFESSENREILVAFQKSEDLASVKDRLDATIQEYYDRLRQKSLPANNIEEKLSDCILRLREESLRRLERKRETVFAAEAAASGSGADLNKLEEQGAEGSSQLRDVFLQRSRSGQKHRRN
ncbi:DNA primase [Chloroflexota bacterium]